MNRPILVIVIGYIIGIIWGLYLKMSIVSFYIFIAILYCIINYQYRKKKFKILSVKRYFRYLKIIFKTNIILTIIISSFISNIIIKYKNSKYENMYKNIEEIKLTGIVVSNKKEKEYSNRYKIKVIEEKYKNSYLYIDTNKNIQLEYGDKVEVKGTFQEPQTSRNYKGFNYKEYLKTLKIYGTIKIQNIKIIQKKCGNKINFISNYLFLKIKSNIEKTYNENVQGIILGVILGYTENISSDMKEQFSESNISHVLAVSGMHISYIIYLVTNSTNKFIGKRKSKIIASIMLIIYMCITGFTISVVRACIMGIISGMAFVVYRKSDTLNNIALSALIILINNPFSLLSLNFLLTFGGTIGIIVFKPNIEKMLKSIKIKNRKWKYVFLKIQRRSESIIEAMSISISAQIIIAPIIILNFNTVGISFLITNLLLSIVIGPIVMFGFIQILISFISIKFAISIASALEKLVYILILISKIGSKIPFGNFKIATPDFYQIVFYYILIFCLNYIYMVFHKKKPNQTQIRVKNMIYLMKYKIGPYKQKIISICILIVLEFNIINKIPHELKIYFIDVGQGDSTLIVTPHNKTILIDGGGSDTYDVGKNTLLPYLLDRKITKLDYVIISHFDQDHSRFYASNYRKTKSRTDNYWKTV